MGVVLVLGKTSNDEGIELFKTISLSYPEEISPPPISGMTDPPQHDEGYIKFQPIWTRVAAMDEGELRELNRWRNRMKDTGLIGVYPDGIGYGNISRRWKNTDQFIISGSATGHLPQLSPEHYSLVTSVDIEHNRLCCTGPILASSESMSHAVIYRERKEVNGVIHIHHLSMWEKLLHLAPTTADDATYGSPEMAYSITELLQHREGRKADLFVMAGHREGIFAFGHSLADAGRLLLAQLELLA